MCFMEKKNIAAAREVYSWGETVVYAVTLVIIALSIFFRTASVDGESMIPTLQNNDQLIISDFLYKPQSGDIIVFDSEKTLEKALVKRVIATEGQTVSVNAAAGQVTVDGKVLSEDYIAETTRVEGNQTYPLTVPEGKIFVMGDNRNNSLDSRFQEVDCIDTRYVLGKVLLRFSPFSKFGVVK